MIPAAPILACVVLLLAALLAFAWQLVQDERCGRVGAQRRADRLQQRVDELEALVEEQRICPGGCINRSVEQFARGLAAWNEGIAKADFGPLFGSPAERRAKARQQLEDLQRFLAESNIPASARTSGQEEA